MKLLIARGDTYHPDIVVVTKKAKPSVIRSDKQDGNKLRYVPLFYPILKSSIDLSEDQQMFQINQDTVIFKLAINSLNFLN